MEPCLVLPGELNLSWINCLCVFQFVEKRREMKADGRTDKELDESYCFLLTDAVKVRLAISFVIKRS